ncbi:unnamed protein product [Prorocentrum cordatum]|uniref:Uncharacterized protein n=1 Tax=Prorocentrum cordatum TaxID=2364126 RepID=A0ABN9U3N0_9DINO|nr:unnamed protein product [Polarella glacialis]
MPHSTTGGRHAPRHLSSRAPPSPRSRGATGPQDLAAGLAAGRAAGESSDDGPLVPPGAWQADPFAGEDAADVGGLAARELEAAGLAGPAPKRRRSASPE